MSDAETKPLMSMKDAVREFIRNTEKVFDKWPPVSGLPTGFQDLDALLCGLENGTLTIVAGPSGGGKSALVCDFVRNAAEQAHTAALLSLEMTREQIIRRMLAAKGRIDLVRLRGGALSVSDWPRLAKAAGMLSDAPVAILDPSEFLKQPNILGQHLARLREASGLRLFVLDGCHQFGDSRVNTMSQLKRLALEFDIPVVTTVQISAAHTMPWPDDLERIGIPTADADAVLILHRDCERRDRIEFRIAKNRHGPPAWSYLGWDERTCSFSNYVHPEDQAPEPPADNSDAAASSKLDCAEHAIALAKG